MLSLLGTLTARQLEAPLTSDLFRAKRLLYRAAEAGQLLNGCLMLLRGSLFIKIITCGVCMLVAGRVIRYLQSPTVLSLWMTFLSCDYLSYSSVIMETKVPNI